MHNQKLVLKKHEELFANVKEESDENSLVIIHFFHPAGSWDWYALEGKPIDGGKDWLFFGYVLSGVDPAFDEFGCFSLSEFKNWDTMGLYPERESSFPAGKLKLSEIDEVRDSLIRRGFITAPKGTERRCSHG